MTSNTLQLSFDLVRICGTAACIELRAKAVKHFPYTWCEILYLLFRLNNVTCMNLVGDCAASADRHGDNQSRGAQLLFFWCQFKHL